VKAVADLDGARKACVEIVQPYAARAAAAPDGGQTAAVCLALLRSDWIGDSSLLPDGSEVRVEATSWEALAEAADLPRGLYPVNVALDPTHVDAQVRVARAEIVDAWNAKHGIEAQDERGPA
jgi:hypothetical protein